MECILRRVHEGLVQTRPEWAAQRCDRGLRPFVSLLVGSRSAEKRPYLSVKHGLFAGISSDRATLCPDEETNRGLRPRCNRS
jgi:hypothetical protein